MSTYYRDKARRRTRLGVFRFRRWMERKVVEGRGRYAGAFYVAISCGAFVRDIKQFLRGGQLCIPDSVFEPLPPEVVSRRPLREDMIDSMSYAMLLHQGSNKGPTYDVTT